MSCTKLAEEPTIRERRGETSPFWYAPELRARGGARETLVCTKDKGPSVVPERS
jgi:hypothetical protein